MSDAVNRGRHVLVFCASSGSCDPAFHAAAASLGRAIARNGDTVVYGGGAVGSMGALADGALSQGGRVIGVIPKFMTEVEWQHPGLATLEVVEDMRERKHRLLAGSDAVVALPGGCGTLEELFEAITLKRLGLYFNPIVLLNTRGYYTALAQFLETTISERFMNPEHAAMWSMVDRPEDVLPEIRGTPRWHENARVFSRMIGLKYSPRRLSVIASTNSSSVPQPPGSATTACARSSIRRLRSCMSDTTWRSVRRGCAHSRSNMKRGRTPSIRPPRARAPSASAPIDPTPPPPQTMVMPAAARFSPRRRAASRYAGSERRLEAQ